MHFLRVLALCAALAGCAAQTVQQASPSLFRDELFAERFTPTANDVFALSEQMKRYVDADIQPRLRAEGKVRGLVNALYSPGQLKLEYDAEITRNAAEAFEDRAGNCLSLVVMTAALAKHLGLNVQYQQVIIDDTWSRAGDMLFAAGHVNITLGKHTMDRTILFGKDQELTIDFLPQSQLLPLRTRNIPETRILAMYMNNRAAESLTMGQVSKAYWWVREAIRQDPVYVGSYNTLGVIYRQQRVLDSAEQVLRHGLQLEPANARAMSNLVLVLADQGKAAESRALAGELKRIEPYPPFHFFNRGREALQQQDYLAARDLFQRELARNGDNHEIHFGLAAAYAGLGDAHAARKQLTLAMEKSPTRNEQGRYSAKLERLKATSYQ